MAVTTTGEDFARLAAGIVWRDSLGPGGDPVD